MSDYRIKEHPILAIPGEAAVPFTWKGEGLKARPGETIASALFASGVRIFGHHHKDGSPQGIFCANGQCAQCSVVANGLSVKSCMVPVTEGMAVEPLDGKAMLLDADGDLRFHDVETVETECLILGGGPAGLAAAIELGKAGVNVVLVDDKAALGGKLVLQTHKFFGSIEACHAGTRGMDIGKKLEAEVRSFPSVRLWTETTALAVFSDRKVGVLRGSHYVLVRPHVLLVATGAREKSLVFKGNTLPGVYGAGRVPDSREPRPRPPRRAALRRRRRERRPHRRLPRAPGGDPGRGPLRGARRLRRLQGPQGQARQDGRADPHAPHRRLGQRNGGGRKRHHRAARPVLEGRSRDREDVQVRHAPRRRRPRPRRRVPEEGEGVRPARPRRRRRRGDRRGERGDVHREDQGDRDRADAGPRRRRGPRRVAAHGRGPEGAAGGRHHRGDPRARGGCLPDLPLLPGDPLQPVHVDLPEGRDQDRGGRHPRPADVRRERLHRLRAVRGDLPRPRRDARRLPEEGRRRGPRLHPLRVPEDDDQGRRHGDGPRHARQGARATCRWRRSVRRSSRTTPSS